MKFELTKTPTKAQPINDAIMDLVDRLGHEWKDVDPRAWVRLMIYTPVNVTTSPEGISYEHLFELAKKCGLIGSYSLKELNDRIVGYARVVLNDVAVQEAFVRANQHLFAATPAPSVADAAGASVNLQNVFNELREDFSVADSGKALKAVERAIAKESGND